jgi:hypothetical protein
MLCNLVLWLNVDGLLEVLKRLPSSLFLYDITAVRALIQFYGD